MKLNDLFTKATIQGNNLVIDLPAIGASPDADRAELILWRLLSDLNSNYLRMNPVAPDSVFQMTFSHTAPRFPVGNTAASGGTRPLNPATQNFSLSFNGLYEVSDFKVGVIN